MLGINKNGEIAGFPIQIAPSAPAIFADADGNLLPNKPVPAGGVATLYLTGAGEVSPALKTGFTPAATTPPASLPKPRLPLSVTVAGAQAFLPFVGLAPGLFGTTEVNFTVPASVPPGPQPVVVTVGGISSPPVTLMVQTPVTAATEPQ